MADHLTSYRLAWTKGARIAALILLALGAVRAKAAEIQTPDGKPPMVHWAILESTPGDMDQMQAFARENVAPRAPKEQGTYALYGGVDATDPNRLCLLEIYRDESAYEIHVGSDEFHEYKSRRAPILKSLIIVPVEPIALEQKPEKGTEVWMRTVVVDKDDATAFRALARQEALEATRKFDGVIGYFATEDAESGKFMTLEVFRDSEARANYRASSTYVEFRRKRDLIERGADERKLNVGVITLTEKYREDDGKN